MLRYPPTQARRQPARFLPPRGCPLLKRSVLARHAASGVVPGSPPRTHLPDSAERCSFFSLLFLKFFHLPLVGLACRPIKHQLAAYTSASKTILQQAPKSGDFDSTSLGGRSEE